MPTRESDWEKTHPEGVPSSFRRPGGMKMESLPNCKRLPERIVEHAVKGMLPKNSLDGNCSPSLKSAGTDHPHQAQNLKS